MTARPNTRKKPTPEHLELKRNARSRARRCKTLREALHDRELARRVRLRTVGPRPEDAHLNHARDGVRVQDLALSQRGVRPMLDQHAQAAPESQYVGTETVPLRRLDLVVTGYLEGAGGICLKVDTEGYESAVLGGAPQLLQRACAVQLEMSLVPLYEGQELWEHFLARMQALGFVPWTLLPGFVDDATGRTLQVDAVFLRP